MAIDVANPMHPRTEFVPFGSSEEVAAQALGAEWASVDLRGRVFTVRRAFAKGRLKTYAKTDRSRRRVPLRAQVLDALAQIPGHEGILFPSAGCGRIDINNFRSREWLPALKAAGLPHRRIYDMRHTFATWSLAAGMSIFTLARRMGTSVQMIDRTYGHLAQDAEDQDRELLDAYDAANDAGHAVGATDELDGAADADAA
ncbi:MAG TPA: site-specific integrase [Solirubrobacteraceae bacterium]